MKQVPSRTDGIDNTYLVKFNYMNLHVCHKLTSTLLNQSTLLFVHGKKSRLNWIWTPYTQMSYFFR